MASFSPPTAIAGAFQVDWGRFAPLKLRARQLAEGIFAGVHRSSRKGAGVEFGGQRPYVPGDDLRFFDRRSFLKYDRLMVREFLTETERTLYLVVDATASMRYRGDGAPGAKFAYASLLAAALAYVSVRSGDPVGLCIFGGTEARILRPSTSRDAFDRVCHELVTTRVEGDFSTASDRLAAAFAPVLDKAKRGTTIVVISDFLDLPRGADSLVRRLGTRGRSPLGLMVLDPDERDFPFRERGRYRSLEGNVEVDADPEVVRGEYLARLQALTDEWRRTYVARGGTFVTTATTDRADAVLARLLLSFAGGAAGPGFPAGAPSA